MSQARKAKETLGDTCGLSGSDWAYAVNLIETVCWLAGDPAYLDSLTAPFGRDDRGRDSRTRTAVLFDRLAANMSYQGISDAVASSYMAQHGRPKWAKIAADFAASPSCPKLASFWHFHSCHYRKANRSCSTPQHIETCPLPRHTFRNGNLNQLAYSFFLFIRDVADGDLVRWIDCQIAQADDPDAPDRIERLRAAVLEPLAGIHGVSDKILNMIMADFLLSAGGHDQRWAMIGGSMIAIDTLVHNFLHRTGILDRAHARHPYGPRCYGDAGCKALIVAVSRAIDARAFNPTFPTYFPRYIQRSIWRFCAQNGLDVCNGRNIDDTKACAYRGCRLFDNCDRRSLSR